MYLDVVDSLDLKELLSGAVVLLRFLPCVNSMSLALGSSPDLAGWLPRAEHETFHGKLSE